ncbi:hypothetical protein [Planomonospora parontospora]|uniref:hypothetical protein n=1 Tax=Planomonospora parontospora TaxID=58119 RepID=UPI001670EE7A|nr:hypothetical protein [Planomonospora parontospora]GGL42636.1 hypothetical protein GCM10014719_49940 [Planomonospora parontospora subsp. antibiotica]GII18367.1 hypothetical protein Ppa05_50930 [Planomonospora parontospora subsp. antibiotica]
MGAHPFTDYVLGTDVQDAYDRAVADAIAEYGHGRYNGTISTTDGYLVLSDTPVPLQEALDRHIALLDGDSRIEKRGSCGAIPILDSKRRITAPIPATADGYRTWAQAVEAALAAFIQPGEHIADALRDVTGHFVTCKESKRIVSGSVTVTLTGSRPGHAGWLFFGWAAC